MLRSFSKETTPLYSPTIQNGSDGILINDDTYTQKKTSLAQRISISAPVLEFIGTFVLVFVICVTSVTQDGNMLSSALSVGGIIVLLAYSIGHISGGHFNPAVSLATFIRGKLSLLSLVLYILVQLFGGLLGSLLAYGVTEKRIKDLNRGPFCPQVNNQFNTSNFLALICEAIWTSVLCFIFLNVTTTKSQEKNSFFGLAIGGTVTVGILVLQPISGAVFNPSVATGACITNAMLTSKSNLLTNIWIYWVGDLLGAALGSALFLLTNVEELKVLWKDFSWQNFFI